MRPWILAVLLLAPACVTAETPGVNVYGLSYHFDRERARELDVDNQVNPGLGLRYRVQHNESPEWIFDIGAYRDSGRNTAVLAGAGALWRLSEGWRLGVSLGDAQLRLHSESFGRERGGDPRLLGHLVGEMNSRDSGSVS